jgi:hypothetical protein
VIRTRHALLLAVVLGLTIAAWGCGDGGDGDTVAVSQMQAERSQAQARADAEEKAAVEAHNDEVLRTYEQRQETSAPSRDEEDAKQTADDFYAILGEDDAARNPNRTAADSGAFCELMSAKAREQTIRYAKLSAGVAREWDCESAVELLIIRAKRTGGFARAQGAKVLGVNANGDSATATVQFGNGPVTSVPLVKENGKWKLAASLSVPQRP